MKKLFLLLFLSISTLSQAQTRIILNNEINVENSIDFRDYDLTTKTQYYDVAGGVSALMLSSGHDDYKIKLRITSYNPFTIGRGRLLLLKLQNGEVVTLQNTKRIGPNDYTYWEGDSTLFPRFYMHPVYPVTEEQIQKIIEGNVIKLRLETDEEHIDAKVKRNRFSNAIVDCYNSLQERLDGTHIYNNF